VPAHCLLQAQNEPRRRPPQSIVWSQLDLGSYEWLIVVLNVHMTSARRICSPRDASSQRRVVDRRVYQEILTGLEADANLDRQRGIAVQALIRVQQRTRS
jgi:hypothetical protein